MFIRAGTDGAVRWVPRVNRDKSLVCGFAPSVAAAALARKPAQVVASPAQATPRQSAAPTIPDGYKAAWTDGRLNALRGPRTEAGDAAMALVWTDAVPMRRK